MGDIIGHGNTTSAGWVPEPTMRGTWSIYSTCLATMALCAWQAVHLNIPPPGEPEYKQTLRKVGWMILAVIAPEVVAATAWLQYKEARSIYQYMSAAEQPLRRRSQPSALGRSMSASESRESRRSTDPETVEEAKEADPRPSERFSWTCAYFVAMGGVVLQSSGGDAAGDGHVLNRDKRIRTLDGSKWNAVHDLFPDDMPRITHENIVDRSKASNVTKLLVCSQALWFCLQCITRLAQRLDVTLLELNTFAHCVCAALIYGLWWHKPYDVASHLIMRPKDPRWRYIAYDRLLCEAVSKAAKLSPKIYLLYRLVDADGQNCTLTNDWKVERTMAFSLQCVPEAIPGTDVRAAAATYDEAEETETSAIHHRELDPEIIGALRAMTLMRKEHADVRGVPLGISQTGMRRGQVQVLYGTTPPLRDAREYPFPNYHVKIYADADASISDYIARWKPFTQSEVFIARKRNWLIDVTDLNWFEGFGGLADLTSAALACILYGGLHALAWHYEFRTRVESVLWRVSALLTAASGLCLWLIGLHDMVWGLVVDMWMNTDGILSSIFDHLADVFAIGGPIFGFLIAIACVLARAFLVVESFITVPTSPLLAYKVAQWAAYFPHIT